MKQPPPQGIPSKGVVARPAHLAVKPVYAQGHPVMGHPEASPVSPTAVQREIQAKERRAASKRVFRIFVEEFLAAYVQAYPAATPEEGRDAAAEHWKSMPLGERAVYEALAACQVAHTIPEHVRLALRRREKSVVRPNKQRHREGNGEGGARLGYVEDNGPAEAGGGT